MGAVDAFRNILARPGELLSLMGKRTCAASPNLANPRIGAPVHIKVERSPRVTHPLIEAMFAALEEARGYGDDAGLPKALLQMGGMSGRRYRRLINGLVRRAPQPRYLEIGSWGGSTLCSAISSNKVRAVAIDNWSEFGGPVAQFFRNLADHVGASEVSVITKDFRQVQYDALGKFNIYLFDGPHERADHFDGVALPQAALDDVFVFIVDDWNWGAVRDGTMAAIAAQGLEVLASIEARTTLDGQHSGDAGLPVNQDSDWHNGYYLAVLRKSGKKGGAFVAPAGR